MSICQLRVTHLSINQYFVKTKQNLGEKKKKIMHRKRKFELHRALLFQRWAAKFILPARRWRQKSTLICSPITNCEAFNILLINIHQTP